MILQPPPTSAVAFVDGQHGWVGARGGLFGTTDGKSFRLEVRAPIAGIASFDRDRAWAITGDGFVLRTSDGRRWSRLGAPHLSRLQVVDARVAFGLTYDGVLVRSADAGMTWPQARAPGLVQSECFSSRRVGWVARGGSVWSTRDGGRRWSRARLQPDRQGFPLPNIECQAGDAWVVFHAGAAAGTEGYRVYRTRDGGSTWRAVLASPFQRRLPSISNYAGPFDVLGGGAAVLVGGCAPCDGFGTTTIVRTLDGGGSFTRTTAFRGYQASAVSFVDPRRGWLLTGSHVASASPVKGGILWSTADGGRHWRAAFRSPALGS